MASRGHQLHLLLLLALTVTVSSQSLLPHLPRPSLQFPFKEASQNLPKLLPNILIPPLLSGEQTPPTPTASPPQQPSLVAAWPPPAPSSETRYSTTSPPPRYSTTSSPSPSPSPSPSSSPPPPPSPPPRRTRQRTQTPTIGIPGAIGAAVNQTSFTGGKGNYPMMARECLEGHNKVREQVGEAPLKWDKKIARYAKRWLNTLRSSCLMIHSETGYRLGENMFNGTGWDYRASQAVQYWADEVAYYDRKTNTCEPKKKCGHYTQMVWNSTTHLGCARVECYNGGTLVSCNYYPPGNWKRQNPFVNQPVIT